MERNHRSTVLYSQLKDPEIKGFIDHMADLIKLNMKQDHYYSNLGEKIAYRDKKNKRNSNRSGSAINKWLRERKNKDVSLFSKKEIASNKTSRPLYTVTGIEGLDIKSKVAIMDQVDYKRSFDYVNDQFTKKLLKVLNIPLRQKPFKATPMPSREVKLYLKKIHCVKDTKEINKDEIAMGGITVDGTNGRTELIREFFVDKFKKGDSEDYNPALCLKSFKLGNQLPVSFLATLTLAEKDGNGFDEFLQALFDMIEAEVILALGVIITYAGVIGFSIGAGFAGIGALVGTLIGLVVGAIAGIIITSMNDDIFEPFTTHIEINNILPFTSDIERTTLSGFGGTYYVDTYWSVE